MTRIAQAFPRPTAEDCTEYWRGYTDLIQGTDILAALEAQAREFESRFGGMEEERGNYAYAEGKWTIKEVLGHLIDCERIFGVRALAIARGESQDMFGFEQDDYVSEGQFNKRTVAGLLAEFFPMRASHLALFASLSPLQAGRNGKASGSSFTARTYPWLMAGHAIHHFKVLDRLY